MQACHAVSFMHVLQLHKEDTGLTPPPMRATVSRIVSPYCRKLYSTPAAENMPSGSRAEKGGTTGPGDKASRRPGCHAVAGPAQSSRRQQQNKEGTSSSSSQTWTRQRRLCHYPIHDSLAEHEGGQALRSHARTSSSVHSAKGAALLAGASSKPSFTLPWLALLHVSLLLPLYGS